MPLSYREGIVASCEHAGPNPMWRHVTHVQLTFESAVCLQFWKTISYLLTFQTKMTADIFEKDSTLSPILVEKKASAVCWHFLKSVSCLFTCVSWTWATCQWEGFVRKTNRDGECALHYCGKIKKSSLHFPKEDAMIMKLLMEHGSDVMAQTKEVRATTSKKYWAGKHSGTADLHAQWMTKK